MFEHEGAHLLAVNTKGLDSCGAGPNEITHRFVPFIRNPHCREFPSPKKLGQRDGVAVVCLDPIDLRTIVTNRANEMWGTDMTRTITTTDGNA